MSSPTTILADADTLARTLRFKLRDPATWPAFDLHHGVNEVLSIGGFADSPFMRPPLFRETRDGWHVAALNFYPGLRMRTLKLFRCNESLESIQNAILQSISAPSAASRSLRSVESASERARPLVKRAMAFLESDREVACLCLNDTSALLGSEARDSGKAVLSTCDVFRPGCLAAWQVKRTLAYIEANLESKLRVDHLADGVALSEGHFSRAFRQSLGIPPKVYVATRRVERAKIMMTSTRERLMVIALACGFSDQSHLNRAFRRFVGVSPGRWRRSNAEVVDSSWLRSISMCK